MASSQEGRVRLLRRLAIMFGGDLHDMVVRYKTSEAKDERAEFAIATIIPSQGHHSENDQKYKRWLMANSIYAERDAEHNRAEADAKDMEMALQEADILVYNTWGQARLLWNNPPAEDSHCAQVTGTVDDLLGESAEVTLFAGQVEEANQEQ
ncbi:MAG: hypothetical protein Q9228_004505 [Teloschistes exilis]